MPGGHATLDATLPRRVNGAEIGLERLTTLRVEGVTSRAWEGRIEHVPSVSGDQVAVSPSAVGWQAALSDDNSARFLGIDRTMSRWTGPSRQRMLNLISNGAQSMGGAQQIPDESTGVPVLRTGWVGPWNSVPSADALLSAGVPIGRIRASWARAGSAGSSSPWGWRAFLSSDDILTSTDTTGVISTAGPGTVDLAATTSTRKFALLQFFYNSTAAGTDGTTYAIDWTSVRLIGPGLTVYGTEDPSNGLYEGLLASDIVAYIVQRFAPTLNFTTGPNGTIRPSAFVIGQFAHLEPTTAAEMVGAASRFGLEDWAVWDDRTVFWAPRGTFGRRWRARVGPAQLQETGPQVDRLWNCAILQYRDVDGTTRTVGFPGSGADVEDESLRDSDPENPANKLGITRCAPPLRAGTLTPGAAIKICATFLDETKRLDASGRAAITGHAMDQAGVLWPYHEIRAGDEIEFIDAAAAGYRRIVRVEHEEAAKTARVDLDAPPDALNALLERLGVEMAAAGFD